MKESQMVKTYVLHEPRLKERRAHLEPQLIKEGIEAQWITVSPLESITPKDIDDFCQCRPCEISLYKKMIACWQDMIDNNHTLGLILEDDVILSPGFNKKLNFYIKELPLEWDVLVIGHGHGFRMPEERLDDDTYVYSKSCSPWEWPGRCTHGWTRGLDAVVYSLSCVKKLIHHIKDESGNIIHRFNYAVEIPKFMGGDGNGAAVDWWLNEIGIKESLQAYWGEPTLCMTGSTTGLFHSSLV